MTRIVIGKMYVFCCPSQEHLLNDEDWLVEVVIMIISELIKFMYINQKGESLSKLGLQSTSKAEKINKIQGSFQQLYQLLSKQTMSVNPANRNKSTNRKQSSPGPRFRINVEYSVEEEESEKGTSHFRQLKSVTKTSSEVDIYTKSGIKKRNTHLQVSRNEKLKNLILGKRKRTQDNKISWQEESDITVPDKVPENDNKFRSVTEGNPKKSNFEAYLKEVSKEVHMNKKRGLSEHIRQIPKKNQRGNLEKEFVPKLRTVRQKKRLNIKPQHLINNTEDIYRSPYSQTQPQQSLNRIEIPKIDMSPQNQISKRLAEVMKPQSTIIIKKEEIEYILSKYCPEQLVGQHILWKMQKMQQFHNILLETFSCEIKYLQTVRLPKYNRKNQFYHFYVGPGNNRNLIVETMERRWWWKESNKIEKADLVWTQEKNQWMLHKPQGSVQLSFPFDRRGSKDKSQLRRLMMSECKGLCQSFLFQSYQSKNDIITEEKSKTISREGGLHNHLIHSNILGDKKSLFALIKLYRISFQKMKENELFSYIPQTYHIDDLSSSFQTFADRFIEKEEKGTLWIVKPGQNSNRGRNIFISCSLEEIRQAATMRGELGGSTIIQEYKFNLLLYKGRKFDIRTFLLCISLGGHRKFYWYAHGYARTSSHPFSIKDLDNMIHLTNDAIQNQGQQYGRFEKGNKVSFSRLQTYLNENFPEKKWKMEYLLSKMKDIAKELSQACDCLIDSSRKSNSFELFGMDFIVDGDFKPWLLQVNTNPCLQVSSPLLKALIPNLIQNVFRLAVDSIYRPTMFPDKEHEYSIPEKIIENNKFQLLFDSWSERDQDWQQYARQHWSQPL